MATSITQLLRRNSVRYGVLLLLTFALGLVLMLDHQPGRVAEPAPARFEKKTQTPDTPDISKTAATVNNPSVQAEPDSAINSASTSERFPRKPGPTSEWAIKIRPGSNIETIARQLGGINLGPVATLPDTFIVDVPGSVDRREEITAALSNNPDVLWHEQQIAEQLEPDLLPTDPFYSAQWHLDNRGQTSGLAGEDINVRPLWIASQAITGAGVNIAIVDVGVQYTHPDIAANYAAALSYDFNGNDADPAPVTTGSCTTSANCHGTAVAGLAAARDNGTCGAGVSFRAGIAGIRLIASPVTPSDKAAALTYLGNDIDIYNNSWGPTGDAELGPASVLELAAMENAARNARGGLGSVYVWSGGNDGQTEGNVNYRQLTNSPYAIAVAATSHNGLVSSFSSPGAALLVAAPSSPQLFTSDLLGTAGYSTTECTSQFSGTSAAAPIVSGVVALMLEANPALSLRDIQTILLQSAEQIDPAEADWQRNGGRFFASHKYGFGRVDAAVAVNASRNWKSLPAKVITGSGPIDVNAPVPDNTTAGISSSYTVSDKMIVEHVEVLFRATTTFRGDLAVTLVSPSGTESLLARPRDDQGDNYNDWRFMTVQNWGEKSSGNWTLKVSDEGADDIATFESWQLILHGVPDNDADGIPDARDNCAADPNPGQENLERDSAGDLCDADDDNDGIADISDSRPRDSDNDGTDNTADNDDDNDGVADFSVVIDGQQTVRDSILKHTAGTGANVKLAQMLSATQSGYLTEIQLPVGCNADLQLEIQGVSGGKPNGRVLASELIDRNSVPDAFPYPFRSLPLSNPIWFSAGDLYAVVITTAGQCNVTRGPIGDNYPLGGMSMTSNLLTHPKTGTYWQNFYNTVGNDLPFKAIFSVELDQLPLNPAETLDTDRDTIGNNADPDDDNDGMPDVYEIANGFNPLVADSNGDNDNDGLTNLQEFNAGTSPFNRDTDNDGFDDKTELAVGRNPLFNENSDLRISNTVTLQTPAAGNPVEFRIRVDNGGPLPATNIQVLDKLPKGMAIPSSLAPAFTPGTYSALTGSWQIGTLNASGFATLNLPAIPLQFSTPECFVNEASITSFTAFDPSLTDNSAISVVYVGGVTRCAHLKMDVTPEIINQQICNGGLTSNNRLDFRIRVNNVGPDNAENVNLVLTGNYRDLVEPYIGTRTVSLGTLASGQTVSRTLGWILPCGQAAAPANYSVALATTTTTSTDSVLGVSGTFNVTDTGTCQCTTQGTNTSPTVNSASTSTATATDGGGSGGGCFIATAAYGSYMHPYVMELRIFRDNVLMQSRAGREFVELYYHHSPALARVIAENEVLRNIARVILTPVVWVVVYPWQIALLLLLVAGRIWYYRIRDPGYQSD